ncbi:MAG: hemolysin III family protein [Bacteroidaceae bacterium]|nr:hemolysin III family protein [Bacteroidaceae bacterium]
MIRYTIHEERINTWSHAAGILLGVVVGTVFLVWCMRADDGWAATAISLYLAGMLGSYIASTVYHALPSTWHFRTIMRKFDHAAIYWHIAGSYSPITLLAMKDVGAWGWGLFCFVWLCAIAGTIASFINLKEHSHLETVCYVLMGLSVLVAFRPLMQCVDTQAIVWLIAEGVMYITGAVFYAVGPRRPYAHSVFHFFVLAGSLCHIACVWDILSKYL